MEKQTVLQEVKGRMKEMQDRKAADLEKIAEKQDEARTQIEAARLAMSDATEAMDVDAYEEARQKRRKAQTALDMYTGRYNQIKQQEYISEAESDKVIDSLLAYEDALAADFKAAAADPLKKLAELHKAYRDEVRETEQALTEWQQNIHANYNTRGGTTFYDEFTGKHTSRSRKPVPVHAVPYEGCKEAAQLGDYLNKAAALYAE